MKFEIKLSTIIAFLLYHAIFVNLKYINGYGTLKYIGLVIVILFLLCKVKIFIKKKYFKTNLILLAFSLTIIISAIYNKDVYGNRSFLIGVFHAIAIMSTFLFFEYLSSINKVKSGINIFYKLSLFYVIITDFIIFFMPKMFLKFHDYFIGNKFDVSYLHILLLILFYQRNQDKIKKSKAIKLKFCLILLLSIFISINIECTTALIGCLLIIILIIISNIKFIKKCLMSNKIMLMALLVSDTILLFTTSILSNKYVSYFIVNVLNEDVTLTGRTRIYTDLAKVLNEHMTLGYGYGNSYFVLMEKIYAPNAQNGLLESVVNYGIIGTIFMCILMYISMKEVSSKTTFYPIIILIYVYIFLSSVEITLGIIILPLFAILNVSEKERRYIIR